MENKKMKSTDLRKSSIPKDIIYDIFSRLPIKSLMRFNCVSRFYNSLISDLYFVDIHQNRSYHPNKIKFLARSKENNFYTIDLKVEDGKASALRIEELDGINCPNIGYVNGLFCLWSANMQPPVIYNPTTRNVRFLPCLNFLGNVIRYYYSLGFDSDEKKYKILMIALSHYFSTRCWVFTLGTSESWREIKSVPYHLRISHVGGVCVDGAIYFFGDYKYKICIVAFNVRTENFKIISPWKELTYLRVKRFYNLIELEGKLTIVDRSRVNMGEMTLRILQSFESEEWVVKHTIDFRRMNLESYFLSCYCSSTADGEIAFITTSSLDINKILFYDFKKKSWREIEIMKELVEKVEIISMCSHVDSLLSCIYC